MNGMTLKAMARYRRDDEGRVIAIECGICHEWKEVMGFYPNPSKAKYGGYETVCKPCHNIVSKKYLATVPEGKKKEWQRKSYQKHRTTRLAENKNWCREHPELRRQAYRRADQKLKQKILSLFGGVCRVCKVSNPIALQVDHIYGQQEISKSSHRNGYELYSAILNGKKNQNSFQLLCARCNFIKEYERYDHTSQWSLYAQKIRKKVFSLFGGECGQCGFSDYRGLQMDHIDGATERRGEYGRDGIGLYLMILRKQKGLNNFQLLCANCHWIKRIENNEATGRPRISKVS